MGYAQRVRPSSMSSSRIVIQRNRAQRISGLGYGLVTLLWLGLHLTQTTHPSAFGTAILLLFSGVGFGLALNRDEVQIDTEGRAVRTVSGLPGFTKVQAGQLTDFVKLEIREGGVLRPGADTTGPFAHRWCTIRLVAQGEQRPVLLWSKEGDETERETLRAAAHRAAAPFAETLGLPVVTVGDC